MRGYARLAGWTAIVVSLCMLPAGVVAAGRVADPLVNSPEQVRKAQTELRRLDCLRGPIDGKLGNQTRQAVRKFWKSAGQPAGDVNVTDGLVADLLERGAGFCRPARRFFSVGGPMRPGGPPVPPLMRGARPPVVPAAAPPPAAAR